VHYGHSCHVTFTSSQDSHLLTSTTICYAVWGYTITLCLLLWPQCGRSVAGTVRCGRVCPIERWKNSNCICGRGGAYGTGSNTQCSSNTKVRCRCSTCQPTWCPCPPHNACTNRSKDTAPSILRQIPCLCDAGSPNGSTWATHCEAPSHWPCRCISWQSIWSWPVRCSRCECRRFGLFERNHY
jgi:hypothetical protein